MPAPAHPAHAHPACLWASTANSRQATSYQKGIAPMLTKLYTSANSLYTGKQYASADVDRKIIDQPHVCLYGTSNPRTLYEGISPSQITDGFLGRIMIFQTDNNDPDEVDPPNSPPPDNLLAHCQAWLQRRIEPPEHVTGNIEAHSRAWQVQATTDPQAEAIYRDFRQHARDRRNALRGDGSETDALWGRAEEQARKVGLIVAASLSFDNITITPEAATYACDLITRLTDQTVHTVHDQVADSEHQEICNRVVSKMKQAGGRMSQREISRATRKWQPKQRNQAISDLLERGEITPDKVETRGRERTDYVLIR